MGVCCCQGRCITFPCAHGDQDASGKDVSYSKFKGKVVYGVNVASRCGYTGEFL